MPPLQVELRPSRLYRASCLALALLVPLAAGLSNLPAGPRLALVAAALGALWLAGRAAPLQRLELAADGQLRWQRAGCTAEAGRYAGYAVLGTLVIFLFAERRGWRRWQGPQRLAVPRDALDADSFRRLRARVRLAPPLPPPPQEPRHPL